MSPSAASSLSPLVAALAVGAGGFVGAIARWSVSLLVRRLAPAAVFPAATFVVNVLGCFAIGVVATHMLQRDPAYSPAVPLLVVTGMLGAFTTFSTFGLETFTLLRDRHTLHAVAYVAASVVLGLLAVLAGRALALR